MKLRSEKRVQEFEDRKKNVKRAGQNKKEMGVGEKMLKKTRPTQTLYL